MTDDQAPDDDPTPPMGTPALGKGQPLGHHVVSELRRLLVPVVTALIAAAAGGGFGAWKAESARDDAVRQAEQRIQESEDRARDLEDLRTEIRRLVIRESSWDEVGRALTVDEDRVLESVALITTDSTPTGLKLAPGELAGLVHNQIQQVQAEMLPPRPAPR